MKRNAFPTVQSQIDYAKYGYTARVNFKKEVRKRRLISFYQVDWGDNAGKYFISFAYYDERDEWIPGLSEEAYITEDQLHEVLEKYLIKGVR